MAANVKASSGSSGGKVAPSQRPPSKSEFARVANIPIYDADGKARPFSSLYQDPADPSRRTLIIFIRHFLCGNCQEYLRTLNAALPPSALPAHTRLAIVGCGDPSMIRFYAEAARCAHPIYAEPTRALHGGLGLARTLDLGPQAPEYMRRSLPRVMLESIGQGLKQGTKAFKGGDLSQVGGEFLVRGDGEVLWAHRMRHTRDHAEVPVLLDQLGVKGRGGKR